MPMPAYRSHAFPLAIILLFLIAGPTLAVITKPAPLAEVLETEDFIFVAALDKVDAGKPSAVFKLAKNLKGEAPFERLPVNMTGNADAKKNNDTQTILDRLDPARKVVFFMSKKGKKYLAIAFVEGSWFSLLGTQDESDQSVRWAFQSGEPYFRKTFKGTSAELIKVVEDGLARKAKPPAPDEKEKPGYGPPVEKKCDNCDGSMSCAGMNDALPVRGPLLGVIPSFVLVGPLAIIAALFPGVFARLAVGMKRWRAFLVIASMNSTLALVYFFFQQSLPSGPWFGTRAFTGYLMTITAVGLVWSGYRYRRFAADEPAVTDTPARAELFALGGLTAFAAISIAITAAFTSWGTNLELPMREFTFIGIALSVAALYASYRALTAHVDLPAQGAPPDRRLSLSGEAVGLSVLLLCGLITILQPVSGTVSLASGPQLGDADVIGPRLVDVKVFEIKKASQVLSGISISGDRLYCGAQLTKASSQDGFIVCMDRQTGEVKWKIGEDEELLPVFCTPRVAEGKVYCGEGLHTNKGCRLFCLNASDGKAAWNQPFKTTSHTEGSPAVAGGRVFFPAGDDGLFAVDAKTGAQLWQFPGGKDKGIHIDAAPAVNGNRVFIGSGLYQYVAACLNAETGNQIWRTDLKLRAFGAPLILGQQIFYGVGTGNMGEDVCDYPEEGGTKETQAAGAVVCLELDTGKELWRAELPRSVHTGLAGDAYSVYACSRDGLVHAFDRKTGKLRWSTGIGKAITCAPAVATADGMPIAVYAVSREGVLFCLNPHTGQWSWMKPLPGFVWSGSEGDGVLSAPTIVTTPTAGGSKRSIYVGAMTVDPNNTARKTAAVFRFEDEIGGEF